jgi:hypothetical protein
MDDEINGRFLALQLMVAGVIARLAGEQRDPVGFLTDFRDEMHALARGVAIGGIADDGPVRAHAQRTLDELFALMKPVAQE